jgi:uncharacterized OB-fold protein
MTMSTAPNFAPPVDTPQVNAFWQTAAEGRLALPACSACGAWQWYPLDGRPCHPDAPLEWRDVPGTGRVFTFTRVERAFLPSGSEPPHTVALVELDGVEGPRLVTCIVGEGSDDVAIGDRVRLSPTRFDTHTLPSFALAGE